MLIKINKNKIGEIFLDEIFFINSLKKLVKNYFAIKNLSNVKLFLNKNKIDLISFIFDKMTIIPRKEVNNFFNEIKFLLYSKFGMEDFKISIIYE